jgi:hypothetical protein
MICALPQCGRNFTQYMLDVCPCERASRQQSAPGTALHKQPARHSAPGLNTGERPAPALPHTRAVRQAAAKFSSRRSRAQLDEHKC